jgi:ABC-type iron transport system FetAB ATPase subunit
MATLNLENLQIEHVGPVNLTVNSGEIICISGSSGAGKSLLLRAIADVLPHKGDARLDDTPASQTSPPAWRKSVALLPAESQWWFDTVGEHFACRNEELLHKLGFSSDTWSWLISRCSTGEKQRLALLRLLCNQPAALLLDEPTGSLDAKNTGVVESIIREYAKQNQVPVIWVSHSEEQIRRICNTHYEVKDGQLVSA